MHITGSELPLLAVFILGMTFVIFFSAFWQSDWKVQARTSILVAIIISLTAVVQICFMSCTNGYVARDLYSIALPFVLLEQIAGAQAFLVFFNIRKPNWFNSLWILALIFLGVSVFMRDEIYPVLTKVPDGYFFASSSASTTFTVLKSVVFLTGLVILVVALIAGLRKQGYRKRWPYALAVFVYMLTLCNDSIVLQHYHTLYPTTWVAAVLFLGMVWLEIRWQVKEVYVLLNRDDLTGAFSRGFGHQYVAKLLEHRTVGLFYADVDRFKYINDTFGHQVGDEVLVKLVNVMMPVMTAPSAVIRLGGDEFLFVFPDVQPHDELSLRTQIEHVLTDFVVTPNENEVHQIVQVSLGFAYGERGASLSDMIRVADEDMYARKAAKGPYGVNEVNPMLYPST